MDKRSITEQLLGHRAQLEALGVRHLYLFGSFAENRGTDKSDVDVMVDLDEGTNGRKPRFSAFDVGRIQSELAGLVNTQVDLVVRTDALRPGSKLKSTAEDRLVPVF